MNWKVKYRIINRGFQSKEVTLNLTARIAPLAYQEIRQQWRNGHNGKGLLVCDGGIRKIIAIEPALPGIPLR